MSTETTDPYPLANIPEVGTYNTYKSPNTGLRFRYIKTGPLTMYFYDDEMEAFKYNDKYAAAYNWEGSYNKRQRSIVEHMWQDELKAAGVTDFWKIHREIRKRNVGTCNDSRELRCLMHSVFSGKTEWTDEGVSKFRDEYGDYERVARVERSRKAKEEAAEIRKYGKEDPSIDEEVEKVFAELG